MSILGYKIWMHLVLLVARDFFIIINVGYSWTGRSWVFSKWLALAIYYGSGKKLQLQLLLRLIMIRMLVLGMDLMVADSYITIICCNDLIGRSEIVSEWLGTIKLGLPGPFDVPLCVCGRTYDVKLHSRQ